MPPLQTLLISFSAAGYVLLIFIELCKKKMGCPHRVHGTVSRCVNAALGLEFPKRHDIGITVDRYVAASKALVNPCLPQDFIGGKACSVVPTKLAFI
jgi:hypothetical protein